MLTDDDLSRQLGGAFRESTDDVTYAGRVPTPRTTAASFGVPLASTAAVVAALAVVWASSPGTEDVAPPSADGPAATATAAPTTTAPTPELVTDTIEVAGFTFSYQRAAGQPVAEVIHVFAPDGLPDGVRPVEVPSPAKAWVGTDPRSGEVAIYLKAPSRFDGQLFGVSSPSLDEEQMISFLHTGVS
jgi:hypothetical protein